MIGALALAALSLWLVAASPLTGDGRNLAPDAVTRATTWNTWEGDLAALVDGETPADDPQAGAFLWHGGGVLVFEWEEPLDLEAVRVYVGAIGNDYEVRAWLGGRLDETGTLREPEGTRTASAANHSRVTDAWTEVRFPAGTRADNIELVALGTIVFHEGEVRGLDGRATVVAGSSWGRLKAGGAAR